MKSFVLCIVVVLGFFVQALMADESIESQMASLGEAQSGEESPRFKKSIAQQGPTAKTYGGPIVAPPAAAASHQYAPAAAPSYGSAYGSLSYPSPAPVVPCARNLLFSCQPSVAPVPCAPSPAYYPAPAPAQAYAGAYSEPIAQWVQAPHY